jgi:signal transduction histidine kinase
MSTELNQTSASVQLERELLYYRRECNELGARLLRLQEEQSQSFREARRSRTVAKLIREAYQLVDREIAGDAIGDSMLEIIVSNATCDRAAFLKETFPSSGRFQVVQAVGCGNEQATAEITVLPTPHFFFTTARSILEPPAFVLIDILRLPYILWAYDHGTGYALIIGNQSESNVSRPFEAGDQEFVEGALHVYLDVLMRKTAETELKLAKALAEEASNMRTRFMATLSHELRTPLNSIIGFSQLLLKKGEKAPTAPQTEEYAAQIFEAGNNLLTLINSILDYSSLTNSRPVLKKEWVSVSTLLHKTVKAFASDLLHKKIMVNIFEPDTALELHVDYTRFRQILTNLISNAIKFSLPGGEIQLSASLTDYGGVSIKVRDSGIGMRPEDTSRAVEPFVQVENVLRRGTQGTGLGLSIAKDLCEVHGGFLEMSSELGAGTTATVIMPAASVRRMAAADDARRSLDAGA